MLTKERLRIDYVNHTFKLITVLKDQLDITTTDNYNHILRSIKGLSHPQITNNAKFNTAEYYVLQTDFTITKMTLNGVVVADIIKSHSQIMKHFYNYLYNLPMISPKSREECLSFHHLATLGIYIVTEFPDNFKYEYPSVPLQVIDKLDTSRYDVFIDFLGAYDPETLRNDTKNTINKYKHPCRLNQPLFPLDQYIKMIYCSVIFHLSLPPQTSIALLDEQLTKKIVRHSKKLKYILNKHNVASLRSSLLKTDMSSIINIIDEQSLSKHALETNPDDIMALAEEYVKLDYTISSNNLSKDFHLDINQVSKLKLNNTKIKNHILMIIMNKIRQVAHLPKNQQNGYTNLQFEKYKENTILVNAEDLIYYDSHTGVFLLRSDGFNTLYFERTKTTYLLDDNHFNYLITMLETDMNLQFIRASDEYANLFNTIDLLSDLRHVTINYEEKVNFMKSYESLCLMKSDIHNSKLISWSPIITVLEGSLPGYSLYQLILCFIGLNNVNYLDYRMKIISSLNNKSPIELIELSTLHKLYYYAEIDDQKGIVKFISRQSLKRPINKGAIDNMTLMFRKLIIKNYYIKNSKLPNSNMLPDTKSLLIDALRNRDSRKYDTLPLSMFSKIEFLKTFDNDISKDPLVYAKDKSCSRKAITFSNHDSISELHDVLTRPDYKLSNNLLKYDYNNHPCFTLHGKLNTPIELLNPTRLCMKEREQKSEGRLFGCATTDNKHELSYYNLLIEKVLDFFPNQLIVIDDSKKKELIHQAGQYLLDPENYSILIDVEGHNQSMSVENNKYILSEIGKLYGITEFDSLFNYFNNLSVYYKFNSKDVSVLFKGQYGGIEGWMNPLWTLITLLVLELFAFQHDVDVKALMCYSDDLNLIIRMKKMDIENINLLYQKLTGHFYQFGFLVKANQTMISKNRSTMLRVHYYNGHLVESSLKKILSISSYNEDFFVNEQIDMDNVIGSINAALERSKKLITLLYLKWYKILMIGIRSYISTLYNRDDNMTTILMNNNSRTHFRNVRCHLTEEDFIKELENGLGQRLINEYNRGTNLESYQQLSTDFLYPLAMNLLMNDNALRMAYFIRLLSPKDLGGAGIPFFINQMVIGHSNSFVKQLTVLLRFLTETDKHYLLLLRSHILMKLRLNNSLEVDLIGNEFPIYMNHAVLNSKNVIDVNVKEALKYEIKNKSIVELIKLKDYEKYYNEELINLSRDRFHHRIVSYYKEKSPFYILNYLYKKVESSRSFVKNLKLKTRLFSKLFYIENDNQRNFFKLEKVDCNSYDYNFDLPLTANLMEYRMRLFPKINFINITEPSVTSIIYKSDTLIDDIMVKKVSNMYEVEGLKMYKNYNYPKGVNMKLELEDRQKRFNNMSIKLIFDNVYITKWLLYLDSIELNDSSKLNVVEICNFNLSLMTNRTFNDLFDCCRLPKGGELLHRLENLQFKAKSYIKCLQESTLNYQVTIVPDKSFYNSYNDSNINMGFLKDNLSATLALCDYVGVTTESTSAYSVRVQSDVVADVNVGFCYRVNHDLQTDYRLAVIREIAEVTKDIKVYLNEVSLESLAKTDRLINDILRLPNDQYLNYNNEDEIVNKEIITYFNDLALEYIHIDRHLTPDRIYLNLYEKMKFTYSSISGLDSRDFIIRCKSVIKLYYKQLRMTYIFDQDELKKIADSLLESDLFYEIKECLQKKLLYVNRISLVKDQPLMTGLKDIIKANNEQILKRLLFEIIIKHAVCFRTIKGKLFIDYNLTVNLLQKVISLKDFGFIDVTTDLMIELIGKDELLKYLDSNLLIIRCLLSKITTFITRNFDRSNIKHSIRSVTPIRQLSEEIVQDVNYDSCMMDREMRNVNIKAFKELLVQYRNAVEVYGSARSFYSHYGSSSLAAGIGIGKYLNKYYPNLSVCDLTAGRGDFCTAFKMLGVNSTSYGRSDLYTDIICCNQIIKMDYDIRNYNELGFTQNYNIIIADISFISDDKGFFDTLGNLLNDGKVLIIRINSLSVKSLFDFIHYNEHNTNFKLLYPVGISNTPYQLYIEMSKGDYIDPTLSNLASNINIRSRSIVVYPELWKKIIQLKYSSSWVIRLTNDDVSESYDKVREEVNLNDLINSYTIAREHNKFSNTLIETVDLMKDYPIVIIYTDSIANEVITTVNGNYEQYNKILNKLSDRANYKEEVATFRRLYDTSSSKYKLMWYQELPKLRLRKDKLLSPFTLFEKVKENLLELIEARIITHGQLLEKVTITESLDKIEEKTNDTLNINNIPVYQALILYHYAHFVRSYEEVMNLMIFYYKQHEKSKIAKAYYRSLILNFKLISNYKIDDSKDLSNNDFNSLSRLSEEILFTVNHFDKVTAKKKKKIISEISDAINRNQEETLFGRGTNEPEVPNDFGESMLAFFSNSLRARSGQVNIPDGGIHDDAELQSHRQIGAATSQPFVEMMMAGMEDLYSDSQEFREEDFLSDILDDDDY